MLEGAYDISATNSRAGGSPTNEDVVADWCGSYRRERLEHFLITGERSFCHLMYITDRRCFYSNMLTQPIVARGPAPLFLVFC